ncbi:MAG TPA: cysteine desulfurase [Candidatus Hydrogenedentes bacterium]|nr:cysteine desulfurase [Candidatus Hydrogenedentota bacterium]
MNSNTASSENKHIMQLRNDFPILKQQIRGRPLTYLDNASTTQKPQCVIDAIADYYASENANVHRGIHRLSGAATKRYESARSRLGSFLGANSGYGIVFTRSATEGINLVAHSLGRALLRSGDEVLVTQLEHHSNIVPWQLLCEAAGAKLRVVPINESGELIMGEFDRLLNERTRIVAVAHVSNALGTINPVSEICRKACRQNAATLVDGAQSAAHTAIRLADMGADFFVCSGHKMYGPTGVGVLCGRSEMFERMTPYQSGSDMVHSVTFEKTTFAPPPHKFEAGTPHIAGAFGLCAAVDYLDGIGMEAVERHERELLAYGTQSLAAIPGLRIIGNAKQKAGILSFVMDGAHPHDIAQLLDNEGIAIRSGHLCAQPTMAFFGVPALARVSFGLYNTISEIDALVGALQKVRKTFI